jgi:NADH-quinone oxidoreductase subunit H
VGGVDAFQVADPDIGLLFLFAVSSMGVYGITLAGWSSNSKYSLLGSLRSTAQMISYELAVGLSVIGVLLMTGSLSLRAIVDAQAGTYWGFLPRWHVFPQIVGFLCFYVGAIAETNRLPFDMPEAETELVAGFHTEYSGMKFSFFFLAEYANMILVGGVATTLFMGGWMRPFPSVEALAWLNFLDFVHPFWSGFFWFAAKLFLVIFAFLWIRATFPRYRYDQLMHLGWKVLLPLSIVNVLVTAVVMLLMNSGSSA